jgi:hypothetical protein
MSFQATPKNDKDRHAQTKVVSCSGKDDGFNSEIMDSFLGGRGGTGTQGFTLAGHVLYNLSHASSPIDS